MNLETKPARRGRPRKSLNHVPAPAPAPVVDMAKVQAAVTARTLDMARITTAVTAREMPEMPQREAHHGRPPEDGGLRKVVARLVRRQCEGFLHADFLHHG